MPRDERHRLRDEEWEVIAPLCSGKASDPGVTAQDNRTFIEAVLWISKTGSPWRDLPQERGNWNSQFKRFRNWAKKGRWNEIFSELAIDIDISALMIDSTVVRVHHHGAGAKKGSLKHLVAPGEA